MKFTLNADNVLLEPRRSPCGERGLKSKWKQLKQAKVAVAPRAGSVG